MPDKVSVKVFNGHDNTFSVTVKEGGSAVDLVSTGVTRMIIRYDTGAADCVDSDVAGEGAGQPFDWATNGASGICEFDLGEEGIDAGQYPNTSLVIFDPLHPDGQVWHNLLNMTVVDELTCT